MSKAIYEVRGTITIEVLKRVKAKDEDEAMELAEKHFSGLTEYCGNGGNDKLVGVEEYSESVQTCGDYVKWEEAYETDNDNYDEATDTGCTFTCIICGEEFECEDDDDFEDNVKELLLNHIEMEHKEEYEECNDWYFQDIIEEYYDEEEM